MNCSFADGQSWKRKTYKSLPPPYGRPRPEQTETASEIIKLEKKLPKKTAMTAATLTAN